MFGRLGRRFPGADATLALIGSASVWAWINRLAGLRQSVEVAAAPPAFALVGSPKPATAPPIPVAPQHPPPRYPCQPPTRPLMEQLTVALAAVPNAPFRQGAATHTVTVTADAARILDATDIPAKRATR